MLKWLRRSTRSWFIYLAIGAIVVVFIFWGVGSYKASRSQEAAEVNGTVIPMTEFSRQYNELVKRYQERTGGEVTPEMIKSLRLKEMALSQLVEEALLLQAGQRLGLEVTTAELRHQIQSYPFFQQDGKFDEKRYFAVLSRHHLSPQGFEAQERQQLLLRKVVEEVTSFAKVSDAGTPGVLPDGQRGGGRQLPGGVPGKVPGPAKPPGRCGGPLLPGERGGISPAGPGPG